MPSPADCGRLGTHHQDEAEMKGVAGCNSMGRVGQRDGATQGECSRGMLLSGPWVSTGTNLTRAPQVPLATGQAREVPQ